MGAAFGSLRDRVSGFVADLTPSEFWGEGSSVEEPDLEKGDANLETQVLDTSGAIEVFQGVPFQVYMHTYDRYVKYGLPVNKVTRWIDLRTRQRSFTIELQCTLSDSDPTVQYFPFIDEKYKNIIINALPYRPISFKVPNIEIAPLIPTWNPDTKKYLVEVRFSGPDTSGAIEVSQGVPYRPGLNDSDIFVENGIPENSVTLWTDPHTRQRSLTIELQCPLSDSDPTLQHLLFIDEKYKNIIINALPYHPMSFKYTNVEIAKRTATWDPDTKKYLVEVHFRGPDNNVARFKLHAEPPLLYQPPPL